MVFHAEHPRAVHCYIFRYRKCLVRICALHAWELASVTYIGIQIWNFGENSFEGIHMFLN